MSTIITSLFAVLLGLAVGSFLNVCIYRVPRAMSIVTPSSFCPLCKRKLSVLELIPVLSFMLQGGRCRHCGARMSVMYPVVETLTAATYLVLYLKFSLTLQALSHIFLFSFLIVAAFIDLISTEVPDSVTVVGTVVGLLFGAALGTMRGSLLGAATGFSVVFVLMKAARYVYSKDAIGDGDAMILMMAGSYLGAGGALLSLYLAFLIGGAASAFLLLAGRKRMGEEVPFGPFIVLGVYASVFFGGVLLAWYRGLAGI